MKILVLTHRFPYPPNKGDRIRTFNVIKYLSSMASVDLATLSHDPLAPGDRKSLHKFCDRMAIVQVDRMSKWISAFRSLCIGKSMTEGLFQSKALQSQIVDWTRGQQYDAVVAFCSSMEQYVSVPELAGIPKVVDFIDIDSQKWQAYADASTVGKKQLFRLEAKRVERLEKKILNDSHAALVVSQEEVALLAHLPGSEKCHAVPNGVDTNFFSPQHENVSNSDSSSCVFVGALDYLPNVEGAIWFCQRVWPQILESYPNAVFRIVGRQPTKTVLALQTIPGVEVHADVADVRPYLSAANAVVAPLQIARGIQNKVLEAMAMARPVIASPEARVGINVAPGKHILVADTPDQWVASLNTLLVNTDQQQRLGSAARQFVQEHHNWDACLKPLDKILPLCANESREVAHV